MVGQPAQLVDQLFQDAWPVTQHSVFCVIMTTTKAEPPALFAPIRLHSASGAMPATTAFSVPVDFTSVGQGQPALPVIPNVLSALEQVPIVQCAQEVTI